VASADASALPDEQVRFVRSVVVSLRDWAR